VLACPSPAPGMDPARSQTLELEPALAPFLLGDPSA
jgi:hypothetical protein